MSVNVKEVVSIAIAPSRHRIGATLVFLCVVLWGLSVGAETPEVAFIDLEIRPSSDALSDQIVVHLTYDSAGIDETPVAVDSEMVFAFYLNVDSQVQKTTTKEALSSGYIHITTAGPSLPTTAQLVSGVVEAKIGLEDGNQLTLARAEIFLENRSGTWTALTTSEYLEAKASAHQQSATGNSVDRGVEPIGPPMSTSEARCGEGVRCLSSGNP